MAEVEMIHGYKVHPAASMLPDLGKRDFKELVADIKEHGLEEPIVVTPDGLLLDGRNRLRAWKEAGYAVKDIPTRTLSPDEEAGPAALTKAVFSLNMARRHLPKAQRVQLRYDFLEAIKAQESEEDTAKATGASVATVRKEKSKRKNAPEKAAKTARGDTSGRGRPKGGGPPRRVVLDREEMTPKELAAFVIKKWNEAPRSYLANFVEQLNEQWDAFEPETDEGEAEAA